MRIAVACGGTGGHIFPGLAVAQTLRERGHEVALWLAGRSVEGQSVAGWGGGVRHVTASGFQSRSPVAAARSVWSLARAMRTCVCMMREDRPDVLLAMGSYASVGPVLAAHRLHIPVVLHEANAIPGRAIGFLSRFAAVVAIGFQDAARYLPGRRTVFTGFPVRAEVLAVERAARGAGPLRVLIMGGSQGAHSLNVTGAEAVVLAVREGARLVVTHLAGSADAAAVRSAYAAAGVAGGAWDFRRDMDAIYAATDLAVCRSGAATCAELAVCGVPALFVPLPSSARGHQEANARALAASGAAEVMLQADMSARRLADRLLAWGQDAARLERMSADMSRLAVRDATARIANLVEAAA